MAIPTNGNENNSLPHLERVSCKIEKYGYEKIAFVEALKNIFIFRGASPQSIEVAKF